MLSLLVFIANIGMCLTLFPIGTQNTMDLKIKLKANREKMSFAKLRATTQI